MQPAPVSSIQGENELELGLSRPSGVYSEADNPSQSPSASMSEADSILSDRDYSYEAVERSAVAEKDMQAGSDQGRHLGGNLQDAFASSQVPEIHDNAGDLPTPSASEGHFDTLNHAAGRSEPGLQACSEHHEQLNKMAARQAGDEPPSEVQEVESALPSEEGPPDDLSPAVYEGHAGDSKLEQADSTPGSTSIKDRETFVLPGFLGNDDSTDDLTATLSPIEPDSHDAVFAASKQASSTAKLGSSSSSVDKGTSQAVLVRGSNVQSYPAGHFHTEVTTATNSSSETQPAHTTKESAPAAEFWMPSESLSEVQPAANNNTLPSTKSTAGIASKEEDPTAQIPSPRRDLESETGTASQAPPEQEVDVSPPEHETAAMELSTSSPCKHESGLQSEKAGEREGFEDAKRSVAQQDDEPKQALSSVLAPADDDKVQDNSPEQSKASQPPIIEPTGQIQEAENLQVGFFSTACIHTLPSGQDAFIVRRSNHGYAGYHSDDCLLEEAERNVVVNKDRLLDVQVEQAPKLHIEIANPAGEVVPNLSSKINEDDWLPNLTVQDPGAERAFDPPDCATFWSFCRVNT